MLEDAWDRFLDFTPIRFMIRQWNIAERKTGMVTSETLGRVRRVKVRVRQMPTRVREKLNISPHLPSSASDESVNGSVNMVQTPDAVVSTMVTTASYFSSAP